MITKFKLYENHKDGKPLLRVIKWDIIIYKQNIYDSFISIRTDNKFHKYMITPLDNLLIYINNVKYCNIKYSYFILKYLEYKLYYTKYNIKQKSYTISKYYYNYLLSINTSYQNIYNLFKSLPKEINQDIIDDFCDEILTINNKHINDLKYTETDYLFSDKIKQKYDYLLNAKNFDLI